MPRSLGQKLRDRGFDRTEYNRADSNYSVRCSQCEALVINGMACHETGCVNERKD
jgi:hypothetical protein